MAESSGPNDTETRLVIGLGCERGAPVHEALELARYALAMAGRAPQSVLLVTSLDSRSEEAAIRAVADHFGVPFRCFDAAALEAQTGRLLNPSSIVFAHTGCHGVAEASALAAAGAQGRLVVPKLKSAHATVAIAESFQDSIAASSDFESGFVEMRDLVHMARQAGV